MIAAPLDAEINHFTEAMGALTDAEITLHQSMKHRDNKRYEARAAERALREAAAKLGAPSAPPAGAP